MINFDDITFEFFELPNIANILERYNLTVYHPDSCDFNTDQYQIVADSWDDVEKAEKAMMSYITDLPNTYRHGDILEQAFKLRFSDEYNSCSGCGKLIKTTPSYYGDLPNYLYTDCELLCSDCYSDNDLIELKLNNADTALNPRQLKNSLESHGFILYRDNLESGYHPGQTDNPQTISKQLESEHPSADWLFCIDGAGQFDIRFSAWYRESNNDD